MRGTKPSENEQPIFRPKNVSPVKMEYDFLNDLWFHIALKPFKSLRLLRKSLSQLNIKITFFLSTINFYLVISFTTEPQKSVIKVKRKKERKVNSSGHGSVFLYSQDLGHCREMVILSSSSAWATQQDFASEQRNKPASPGLKISK